MSGGAVDRHMETIERLETLLIQIAGGVLPNRAEAIVYSRCRSDLLQSPIHDVLPGFLYQCLTIFKFKDFITLYDPDPTLREAFIRRTFGRCRAMTGREPAVEQPEATAPESPTAAAALDPRRWML